MAIHGLVGTGGMAREAMSLAQRMPLLQQTTLVFVDVDCTTDTVGGIPVMTVDDFLALPGDKFFNPAIGNPGHRRRVAEQFVAAGCQPFSIVAESSVELDRCTVGAGAILGPFTLITADASIGEYFHAAAYAYVGHDCTVGNYVSLAPRASINGSVVIEDDVSVGTGAMIQQGTSERPMTLGCGCAIGMGAIVVKPVAAGKTMVGPRAVELDRRGS